MANPNQKGFTQRNRRLQDQASLRSQDPQAQQGQASEQYFGPSAQPHPSQGFSAPFPNQSQHAAQQPSQSFLPGGSAYGAARPQPEYNPPPSSQAQPEQQLGHVRGDSYGSEFGLGAFSASQGTQGDQGLPDSSPPQFGNQQTPQGDVDMPNAFGSSQEPIVIEDQSTFVPIMVTMVTIPPTPTTTSTTTATGPKSHIVLPVSFTTKFRDLWDQIHAEFGRSSGFNVEGVNRPTDLNLSDMAIHWTAPASWPERTQVTPRNLPVLLQLLYSRGSKDVLEVLRS